MVVSRVPSWPHSTVAVKKYIDLLSGHVTAVLIPPSLSLIREHSIPTPVQLQLGDETISAIP
jgi:hypothetical protein